jgi:5-methyltetrahydropteroyltriglutamate--homocysteine methyltransferase
MKRSEDRILTTHAGSLPRPKQLVDLLVRMSRREPVDTAEYDRLVEEATGAAIARQLEAGIDVGNDGEQGRESFFTYVQHRMTGFSGTSDRPVMRDILHFPSFVELRLPDFSKTMVDLLRGPRATGKVTYRDTTFIRRECDRLLASLDRGGKGFAEAFMTSPSPGIVAAAMTNDHYDRLEDYVLALADALRVEYEHVVSRGLLLQLDCPDLAMERHTLFADRPLSEFLDFVGMVIAAINRALATIPPERVRMHVCWGNYEAPHNFDVPLADVLPLLYQAHVGAILLSMANPRHEHEYRCFERAPLPDHMALVVGTIDTTTNYVEHPEVVADRIERAARAVGDPTRVLAGTDCGFATAAGLGEVAEEVVWATLRALREGADLASRRLLGRD